MKSSWNSALFLLRLVVIGASIACLCSSSLGAVQNQEFSVSVDVPLVVVDVGIFDAMDRPLGGLPREAFSIYEDGERQTITGFDPVAVPYNTVLLFDCSDSTRAHWMFLSSATARFVQEQRPGDRLAIAAFGSDVETLADWGKPPTKLESDSRPNACKGSATDVYGAIAWATNKVKSVRGRKGIIILTDGIHDNMPRTNVTTNGRTHSVPVNATEDAAFQQVLRSVRNSGGRVYVLAVNTDLNPASDFSIDDLVEKLQVRSRLQELAESSGGQIIYPRAPGDVVALYEQIGHDLGTSYSLTYTPSRGSAGTYRRIEVRVQRPGVTVRQSREGYVVR